jgi:hypothetical protein
VVLAVAVMVQVEILVLVQQVLQTLGVEAAEAAVTVS